VSLIYFCPQHTLPDTSMSSIMQVGPAISRLFFTICGNSKDLILIFDFQNCSDQYMLLLLLCVCYPPFPSYFTWPYHILSYVDWWSKDPTKTMPMFAGQQLETCQHMTSMCRRIHYLQSEWHYVVVLLYKVLDVFDHAIAQVCPKMYICLKKLRKHF